MFVIQNNKIVNEKQVDWLLYEQPATFDRVMGQKYCFLELTSPIVLKMRTLCGDADIPAMNTEVMHTLSKMYIEK